MAHQYLEHKQILLVLAGVLSGVMLAALDLSIVGVALPRVVSDLGGLSHLSWVVTAYLLTSTSSTVLWGKVSDLYGRKPVYQAAILIFLLGSVLAGLSQSMGHLIGARAVQGLGGGGLFAIALAIIGDVVPPRERGRYQGYFGAVFGASSLIGPLLGGYLTDGPGWRWIFWVNLPVGLAALVVTSRALTQRTQRRKHRLDVEGALLVVGSITSLLLYLNWAGAKYGWTSWEGLSLLTGALLLAGAFVRVELRAKEPILPMRLFGNDIFRNGNLYTFLMGPVMFGTVIFLPVYLQAVKGMSPTMSGLALLPAVLGIAGMSIITGKIVSRSGKYRLWPILGAALLVVSQVLLSTLSAETPYWQVAIYALMSGAGVGATIQTIVVAVQNSVSRDELGVASSANTFFRQTGGAVGTAVFGAVLAARLTHHLAERGIYGTGRTEDVEAIAGLPGPIREAVQGAFAEAIGDLYLTCIPFAVLALLVAFYIREIPLGERIREE